MKTILLMLLTFSASLHADYNDADIRGYDQRGSYNYRNDRSGYYSENNSNQYTDRQYYNRDDTSQYDPVTDRSRLNSWGYQQGWRYDRDSYLRGDLQPQEYEKTHPDGINGIGYNHPSQSYQRTNR